MAKRILSPEERKAKVEAAVERYLKREAEREHRFEARAAFGRGVKVVNVFTGKSWRT